MSEHTYIEYEDRILPIPKHFILPLKEIEAAKRLPFVNSDVYITYPVKPNLYKFCVDIFKRKDIAVMWQVQRRKFTDGFMPIHIDAGNIQYKYNFHVELGGKNVTTKWWDSIENPQKVLHSEVIEVKRWHKINVSTPHNVNSLKTIRWGISVIVGQQFDDSIPMPEVFKGNTPGW